MQEGFATEGAGTGYALRKYAYSLPLHYLIRWYSLPGVLVINVFWYAVMIGTGAAAFLSRKQWMGLGVFLAGIVALPFVHKYIGMANPTIQSMALWFMFFLFYRRSADRVLKSTVIPGVLFCLLILTDFPKWGLVAVPAVLVAEMLPVAARDSVPRLRRLFVALKRATCIFAWGALGIVAASLLHADYFRANVIETLFGYGSTIEALRPGVSSNYLIFLWTLGGFWVLGFVVLFWNSLLAGESPRRPGVRMALTVVAVFSLILWPRSARMFAVTLPFLLYLFAWMADTVLRRFGENRRVTLAAMAMIGVLVGFAVRSTSAGDCFRMPTSVREINAYIAGSPDIPPGSSLATYMQPVFALGAPPGYSWEYLGGVIPKEVDWVLTGDFIDDVIIDAQMHSGAKSYFWRRNRLYVLALIADLPTKASFPCDFYASQWLIVESNFDDGHLSFMLRRAAEQTRPQWRLRYIGDLVGREQP